MAIFTKAFFTSFEENFIKSFFLSDATKLTNERPIENLVDRQDTTIDNKYKQCKNLQNELKFAQRALIS